MPINSIESPKYYWDACVFLAVIEMESGYEVLAKILNEAERGRLKACTSIISIAEVADARQLRNDEAYARIDKLWEPPSPIRLIELNRSLAFEARTLIRAAIADKRALRANDALHLATAKDEGVTEFHTFDQKLLKMGSVAGISISKPKLRTHSPRE